VKDLDIQLLHDDNQAKSPEVISGCVQWRMKLLQFHENRRPAYWGTWKKKAKRVTARKPFIKEEEVDYDFDSDDEWEDEPEDAEEIEDSDKEEKDDQEDGGEPEDDEEGWMVPHGYLSDTERDGTGGDLESFKCKEKEFYKSLKEKTLIGLPFIETEDLSCFIMRLCPVFKSAITIKPVRKRAKKPTPPKEQEVENKTAEIKPERQSQRTPKIPVKKATPDPYAKPPSGFMAMELPSDDEEDMDWGTNESLESSSSSDSDSADELDEEDELDKEDEDIKDNLKDESEENDDSSSDEDLFIRIKPERRKV